MGEAKYFMVSFRWYDTDTFCTNLCIAESAEKAREHYESKYRDVSVRDALKGEVETAKRKGMPVTRV